MKTNRCWMFIVLWLVTAGAHADEWQTTPTGQVTTTTLGKVGIGTLTPEQDGGLSSTQEAPLHIFSTQNKNTMLLIQNTTDDSNVAPLIRTKANFATQNFQSHASSRTISRFGLTLGGWNEFLGVSGNGLILGTNAGAGPLVLGTNNVNRIYIATDGKVGIGTSSPTAALEVNGTITATSVIGAVYQDLAEWVPATSDMAPGTVVVLNREKTNEVMPSSSAYDTSVAGVVSAQPGILLGVAGASKEQVATTGRVKVRVDARHAPIRIGDLLVTSDQAGAAMRSEPMDVGGRKLHQPGTIIGKALEPLDGGTGEILVLLSLQ